MTALKALAGNSTGDKTITNENFKAAAIAGLFAMRYETTTGLTWGYYGGEILVDGVLTSISNGTVALSASTNNYIEADRQGNVYKVTGGFTAGRTPLYMVVTGSSSISSYTDYRLTNPPRTGLLAKSVAGASDVTLTAAEARNEILEFTGALTGNINVILPAAVQQWTVYNNTSGAFTLTLDVSGLPGGVAVGQGKRAIVYADGTNVVRATADV